MSSLCTKRIYADYKNYLNSTLPSEGIYCVMNEENILKMNIMIVGPRDTPYEGGCYFFSLEFPRNYPFNSPKVTIQTQDHRVRLNPNFYKNGKVCLSILGTWTGPGWTSAMTLSTVLLTLQTRFGENPIINEPGYEKRIGSKISNDYNDLLRWYNVEVGIYNSLNPPPGFDCFHDEVRLEFCKNFNRTMKYIDSVKNLDNKRMDIKMYRQSVVFKPVKFAELLQNVHNNIYKDYEDLVKPFLEKEQREEEEKEKKTNNNTEEQSTNTNTNTNTNTKPTSSRRVPNDKASLFEVGTKRKSENNNKMYEVSLRTDGRKYWKKIEN